MAVEIWPLYTSCARYQLAGRLTNKVAPLVSSPTIPEPFRCLIFVLVGLLLWTRQGSKYLLMTMDYVSKFPDAIPPRKVDISTVVTGMVDVFTWYGLLEDIMTDQGSVFVRSRVKDL